MTRRDDVTAPEHLSLVCLSLVCLSLACLLAATAAGAATIDLTSDEIHKLVGLNPGDELGWSLAVGDIDGDGVPELAAGAPGAAAHAGAVYVLSADELTGRAHGAWGDRAVRLEHTTAASRFGSALLFMDVDGDGRDELIVGAPEGAPDGEIRTGQVFIFDLPGAGAVLGPADAAAVVTGEASGDGFGSRLERCDLDGDGDPELLVSAPGGDHDGRADAGLVYALDLSLVASASSSRAGSVAVGIVAGAAAGDALRTVRAADIDGDGTDELILGAHQYDTPLGARDGGGHLEDAGAVYVMPARALLFENLASESDARRAEPWTIDDLAMARISGGEERAFLGHAIAAGDVDADGADDILISAHAAGRSDDRYSATGAAFVVFGDREAEATPLPASLESDPAVARHNARTVTLRGRSMWDIFGLSPLVADVNGDGFADVAIAAQFVNGFDGERQRSGEVYLYRGSLRSVMAAKGGSADRADMVLVGDAGDAVANALVLLDVTGDGRPELVLGAPEASGLDETGSRRGRIYMTPAGLLRAR